MLTNSRRFLMLLGAAILVAAPFAGVGHAGDFERDDDDDGFLEDELFRGDDVVEDEGEFLDDDFERPGDDFDFDRRDRLDRRDRRDTEVADELDAELVLRDVEVFDVDLDDEDKEEFLRFVFDRRVDEIVEEQGFRLVGVDPDEEAESVIAALDRDNRRAVIVGFEPGTDVESFAIASVEPGTVENVDDEGNPPTSAIVSTATVDVSTGRTIGPDLVSVRPQAVIDRAVYVFDEHLDEDDRPSASDFAFVTRDGEAHEGDEIATIDDRAVVVVFDDDVRDAVRFIVQGDAIEDPVGNGNPPGAVGAETTAPDLVDVEQVTDDAWEFTFDQQVIDPDIDRFALVTLGGDVLTGGELSRDDRGVEDDDEDLEDDDGRLDDEAGDSITVRFDDEDLENVVDEVVLGVALAGAVESDSAAGTPNTLGVEPTADRGLVTGPTIGPDLDSVSVGDDGEVVFIFDESIEDDVDADELQLVTESGALVSALEIAEVDGDSVTAVFRDSDVDDAQAFVARRGAVEDATGTENPTGTVRRR